MQVDFSCNGLAEVVCSRCARAGMSLWVVEVLESNVILPTHTLVSFLLLSAAVVAN